MAGGGTSQTGPEAGESRRRKRSAAISLVLVAGAGATALTLGRFDPSQKEEDALVYESVAACIGQGLRTAEACTAEYGAAVAAYATSAPRYATAEDCRAHHGPNGCAAGESVTADAAGFFVPVMAAYLIGRSLDQALPPQPLYRHEEAEAGSSGGGYCTGSGGRVFLARGGSATQVSSRVARTTQTTPRIVSRGGFGGTGRAVAASGHHSGGWSGG